MRQIVLDTETTGLSPEEGHRIIEIGCIELINRKLTGNYLHLYINPNRDIDEGAMNVHGLTSEFLQDKPFFHEIASQLLSFIANDELIIHNAPFDLGFLNHELNLLSSTLSNKQNDIANHQQQNNDILSNQQQNKVDDLLTTISFPLENVHKITDTLKLARKLYPGQRNSLDALCKRLQIDNSHRELHGALLDSELLAKVYLAMTGGQITLFDEHVEHFAAKNALSIIKKDKVKLPLLVYKANDEELIAHQQYLELLNKKAGKNYWETL